LAAPQENNEAPIFRCQMETCLDDTSILWYRKGRRKLIVKKRHIILCVAFSLLAGAGIYPDAAIFAAPDTAAAQTIDICDMQAALARVGSSPSSRDGKNTTVCDLQRLFGVGNVPIPASAAAEKQPAILSVVPAHPGFCETLLIADFAEGCNSPDSPGNLQPVSVGTGPPSYRQRYTQSLTSHAPPFIA
jgi:hypothetical protein